VLDISSSPVDVPADEETLLLQLQLEQKKAHKWLQLANADSNSAHGQYFDGQVVDWYAQQLLRGLLCPAWLLICPNAHANMCQIAEQLLPGAKQVVAASIKAQVVCSCMHTRLIQLHVPGWQQASPAGVAFGDAAPDAWAQWPGVTPFSSASAFMQMGASLPAAAGALAPGITAAAVYCMEPAVYHVAERMGQLQGAAESGAGQLQPFRVIRKAKMCVAQPANGKQTRHTV
jgi:hypothetical protein